jgi:hypothetical protein
LWLFLKNFEFDFTQSRFNLKEFERFFKLPVVPKAPERRYSKNKSDNLFLVFDTLSNNCLKKFSKLAGSGKGLLVRHGQKFRNLPVTKRIYLR